MSSPRLWFGGSWLFLTLAFSAWVIARVIVLERTNARALGPEHIAGKPALVSADVGEGSVVLFGFQPNYRGQTIATWPLLWAALTP